MENLQANVPRHKLTAPKQAMDLRVGAWRTMGSVSSGGTHMRQRVPCCWKWHSSRLHTSTSSRAARTPSFFKSLHLLRIRLRHLGAGFTAAKPQLFEQSLALAHPQAHAVAAAHVFRQQLAIPQIPVQPERRGALPQIGRHRLPLLGAERAGPPGPCTLP